MLTRISSIFPKNPSFEKIIFLKTGRPFDKMVFDEKNHRRKHSCDRDLETERVSRHEKRRWRLFLRKKNALLKVKGHKKTPYHKGAMSPQIPASDSLFHAPSSLWSLLKRFAPRWFFFAPSKQDLRFFSLKGIFFLGKGHHHRRIFVKKIVFFYGAGSLLTLRGSLLENFFFLSFDLWCL